MQLLGCALGSGSAAAAASHRRSRAQRGNAAARARGRRLPCPPQAGSFFDNLFDFESWAPKSSQAWRLGNGTGGRRQQGEAGAGGLTEGDVDVLNRRLEDARQQGGTAAVGAASAAASAEAAADAEAADVSDAEQQPSFLRSTDKEVSAALAQRIAEVASTKAPGGSAAGSLDEAGEEEDVADGAALTGPLLRELIFNKWGKTYDLSFVRRDLPLGKTLICLNVMWTHLEQRSFPMTEEDYDEKLELVALYLNSWGQAERVQSFLRQPARPRKGMPSKPIVGTAISIQLDLDDAIIDEFFSQGGA